MKRTFLLVAAITSAAPAGAFWFDELYCYLESRREENNRWPEQFVEQDRLNASAPFEIMVRNGWRRQNLLGAHHFSEDCTQLSRAGKLRVQWILTQAPPAYRQLYVERSLKPELTQQRVETANEFAALVVRDTFPLQAQPTHILSDGRPATTVDFVNTKFRENMMIPALPQDSGPEVISE